MNAFHERRLPREGNVQFATFHVGELFLGFPAIYVQEVLRSQEMTRIPLAPAAIQGLINLRGQIVAAVDTRRVLHMPAKPGDEPSMNLIIQTEDGAVSLLVDTIGDVLEVDVNSFALLPANVPPEHKECITGVYRLDDRLLLLLNAEQLLERACHSAS